MKNKYKSLIALLSLSAILTTKIQPPNISAAEPEVEPEFYMATIVYSQSIAESTL